MAQMRKDCDDATLVRVDLERKIETMVEEMEFLKKIHADVRNAPMSPKLSEIGIIQWLEQRALTKQLRNLSRLTN